MLQVLNARQLKEWRLFDIVEGVGSRRDDIRMANHTHYMLKAWVQDYTGCAEDFVLKFEGDAEDAETKNEARQALNRLHRIGDSILAG